MTNDRRSPSPLVRWRAPLAAAAVATLAACAGGPSLEIPLPDTPGETPGESRGVPGFDTRTYPGDDAMATWLDASPYRWVGFYLSAPCYTGTSWHGKRSTLARMGWGMAVLFVGEQDWPEGALREGAAPSDSGAVDSATVDTTGGAEPARASIAGSGAEGPRCTRANLSAARGRADAGEAAEQARAEGFGAGTVVYLDVEPVDAVSDSLAAYVGAWAAALSGSGYRPGLYAHARNADALRTAMQGALGAGAEPPPLWVARPGGFSLRRGPAESGYPATIWQGLLDVDEAWGGITLRIDANVATDAEPSR